MLSQLTILKQRPALAPNVRLRRNEDSGGASLLYPEGILELNETACAVVQSCNGQTTCQQIINQLAREYDVERAQIERDVIECINHLLSRKLITIPG
jgi:pyrroloquinoline quinone biosynthesis protein D